MEGGGRRAEIGIPSRSDVNFVREMRVMQDFHTLPTGEQVVTSSRMLVRMALVSWLQKVQVERVVHCGMDRGVACHALVEGCRGDSEESSL